jgi:hypothetical protein
MFSFTDFLFHIYTVYTRTYQKCYNTLNNTQYQQNKLRGLSLQANYTERATANCLRSNWTRSTSIVISKNLPSATSGLENFILLTHINSQTNIDIQDYWVFLLWPSFGFQKNRRTQCFGNWMCFRLQVRGAGDTYSVGPIRKSQPQSLDNTGQYKNSL